MDILELIHQLQEDGELYIDATEEMAAIVEFLILHECKVNISPSGNGSYLCKITYESI